MNINDATDIQKHLAEIKTLLLEKQDLADFNKDNSVDIQDVTAIQMHLAEM